IKTKYYTKKKHVIFRDNDSDDDNDDKDDNGYDDYDVLGNDVNEIIVGYFLLFIIKTHSYCVEQLYNIVVVVVVNPQIFFQLNAKMHSIENYCHCFLYTFAVNIVIIATTSDNSAVQFNGVAYVIFSLLLSLLIDCTSHRKP
uniref:Uncharacterized protein n=1 Tax=Glossina palpalis gambiensis TaxID=67801 RepID=A0A1B0BBH6_9MUSC